jgi:hypothetical protein
VPGPAGSPGPANSLAIGTVSTVAPGGSATAAITGTPPSQTLSLGIPSGLQGATGAAGPAGADGATVPPATVAPLMDGTAAVGTTTKYAREDHRHPTDTSRAAASALAGYLPLTGGELTGSFNIHYSNPVNYVSGFAASGGLGAWYFAADYSDRWAWGVGSQASGANMFFERYDNAGVWLGYALTIGRISGIVDFPVSPTVPTAAAGTSNTQAASTAFVAAAVAAAVVRVQTFSANGTYTPHAKMVTCLIECIGSGGGSGGVFGVTSNQATSGGGGGGAYAMTRSDKAAIGASKAVTIGAAGSAGGGQSAGGVGGDTSVGTLCIAKGGGGGGYCQPGVNVGNGGSGGTASGSTGDVKIAGGDGGGAMGGATIYLFCGKGGSAGRGAGEITPQLTSAGQAGKSPGGGAAGANTLDVTARTGGAGATGLVVITEYCSA